MLSREPQRFVQLDNAGRAYKSSSMLGTNGLMRSEIYVREQHILKMLARIFSPRKPSKSGPNEHKRLKLCALLSHEPFCESKICRLKWFFTDGEKKRALVGI